MSDSTAMTPLSTVMNSLAKKGFEKEFKIGREGARLDGSDKVYQAEDLWILKVYRFEGESDPADMAALYAMEAKDGSKGFLLNAYGNYSDQDQKFYDDFILQVQIEKEDRLQDLD
ncbi:MAG TPA: hypothetical protein VKZ51_08525 [Cyclobacteriaceae bacterium]|nr:hypothetical protein [Cyclobacteriaceae bacterium]